MSEESSEKSVSHTSIFRNWVSLTGLVITIGGFFSFVFLLLMDAMAHFSNPYLGILTYGVAPGFIVFGMVLGSAGAILWRRKVIKSGGTISLRIDLSRPRDRKVMGWFLAGSVFFLLISAVGSYQTYHFSE